MNLDALFDAIDRKDTDAFLGFLIENAAFRFGSNPAIHGHAAIRTAVDAFFASIASSGHTVARVVESDGTLLCEGTVRYQRHDGRELTIPFVNVFECVGDRISSYKIYIDLGPLYAA